MGTTAQKFECSFVRCDHAGAGAGFDAHIADRHPALHRERFDGAAAVFDDVALSPTSADFRDHRKDDVLRADAGWQLTVHVDRHGLERIQRKCLRCEDMLDLGRADAHRECAECTVR